MAGGGLNITGDKTADTILTAAAIAAAIYFTGGAAAPAVLGAEGGAAAGGALSGMGGGLAMGSGAEALAGGGALATGGGAGMGLGGGAALGAGGFGATMTPEVFGMTGAQYGTVPEFGGAIGGPVGPETIGGTWSSLDLSAPNAGGPMPSAPWYKAAGNPLSTENLYKGAMINMLGSSLFGGRGQQQQALPPGASAPQVGGRGGQFQSNAMQQLALLQAAQNARRRQPGMFG